MAAAPEKHDAELRQVMGPARLAYFTPIAQYPGSADRKAAFFLTATGLIITVLFMFAGGIEKLIDGQHPVRSGIVLAMLAALVVLLMAGAISAWLGFIRPAPAMPRCLITYKDIAATDLDGYRANMYAITHREAIRELLHFNYSVALQGAGKFRAVQRSMKCFRVAIVLWMVLLMVIGMGG